MQRLNSPECWTIKSVIKAEFSETLSSVKLIWIALSYFWTLNITRSIFKIKYVNVKNYWNFLITTDQDRFEYNNENFIFIYQNYFNLDFISMNQSKDKNLNSIKRQQSFANHQLNTVPSIGHLIALENNEKLNNK